jgi:hypothetical protein
MEWIARNDNAAEMDKSVIAQQLTVLMAAELFDVPVGSIVNKVVALREIATRGPTWRGRLPTA